MNWQPLRGSNSVVPGQSQDAVPTEGHQIGVAFNQMNTACSKRFSHDIELGAGDGNRTRAVQLGRLTTHLVRTRMNLGAVSGDRTHASPPYQGGAFPLGHDGVVGVSGRSRTVIAGVAIRYIAVLPQRHILVRMERIELPCIWFQTSGSTNEPHPDETGTP